MPIYKVSKGVTIPPEDGCGIQGMNNLASNPDVMGGRYVLSAAKKIGKLANCTYVEFLISPFKSPFRFLAKFCNEDGVQVVWRSDGFNLGKDFNRIISSFSFWSSDLDVDSCPYGGFEIEEVWKYLTAEYLILDKVEVTEKVIYLEDKIEKMKRKMGHLESALYSKKWYRKYLRKYE